MKTVMYNDVPRWLFWTLYLLHPSKLALFFPLTKNIFFQMTKNTFFQLTKKYFFPTMAVPSQVTHGWWHIYQKCTKLSCCCTRRISFLKPGIWAQAHLIPIFVGISSYFFWIFLAAPGVSHSGNPGFGHKHIWFQFLVGISSYFFFDFFLLHPAYLILETQDLGTSTFD